MYLKQSTAAQVVEIGPFLDDTDFKSAETGLTIANTDIKIRKGGGTTHISKNSGGATHIANGYYYTTLDATDTDTVGQFDVHINASGALPVWTRFYVLEEAVYDAFKAASALGYVANAPVNVAQLSGDSTAADNAESYFDGTGYAGVNNVIPVVTLVTTTTTLTNDPTGVTTTLTRLGTPSNLGGGATVAANLSDIEAQTDDIGAAGAGLSAIPWNASWDAEVQSEVQDALDTMLADSVPSDGTRPTVAQSLYALYLFLTERSVSGTTVTVKKVDGTTGIMTFTLNDSTSPTSITRST